MQNIIVITNPAMVANESLVINQLFESGLEVLHLRKPEYSLTETENFLKSIECIYHSRIALHQHHELAAKYGINRLHYPENKRIQLNESELIKLSNQDYIISTSIHNIAAYKKLDSRFNYCFFGPVFNSISKKNY